MWGKLKKEYKDVPFFMATENPRVAAYPPQFLYQRLIEFKRSRGLKSDSAAIVAILESYFLSGTPSASSDTPRGDERLDDLEVKLLACLRM
jgi:hypothetical protein